MRRDKPKRDYPAVFHGRGMEYAESRAYRPSGDLKTIDWRLTARAGGVHTKMFHDERGRPVFLLLHLRAMMQFGTRKRFKSHLAAELAAMLAWVGHDGGDRVGGFILTCAGLLEFPAARTRTAMLRLLHAVSAATRVAAPEGDEVPLATALCKMRDVCRPGTLAFAISDLSDPPKPVETELTRLARRAPVTLLHVQDAMDATLPHSGGRLSDVAHLLVANRIGATARSAHAAGFAARQQMLGRVARKHAMALLNIMTSDDPRAVLQPRPLPHGHNPKGRAA